MIVSVHETLWIASVSSCWASASLSFLRNGKLLNLARGATAIDAAFQIHTEVGLHMHGVEINGKPMPFSYELQNGDVVSILTGEGGKPATDWMRYAKSRSTRSKLRAYFRARQK